MGGKEARDGFWFQDAKALTRLLDDALERRRRQVLGVPAGPELRVRVESAVAVTAAPDREATEPQPTRPAWDGTYTVGDYRVVDECKLGGPTRDDRVTLYWRLRATIAHGVSSHQLAPRLTVGRDSIGDTRRWRDLATEAQVIAVPNEPPARADSAAKLAAEALYYLSTPTPVWRLKRKETIHRDSPKRSLPVTPPLALEDARSVLSRFELDAQHTLADVEAQLTSQLSAVGATLFVDEAVHQLRGWIDAIARSDDWIEDITAESLNASLQLAARYLSIPPHVEALWHRLCAATPPEPVTVIAEQPWPSLQPNADDIVRRRESVRRVVFTAEGGVGKSFLLRSLHRDQRGIRAWIDTTAPLQDLEDAVTLGAWAAARSEETLTIFVDALDHAGDRASLLAALDRSLESYERAAVYASARVTTWTDIRDRLPRWHSVRLERWPIDRVRALAQFGRENPLSTDLLELLRTPLFLDLFRRTFAGGDVVPEGLATRHGVLRAYFDRRVYGDSGAAARRDVLDQGVAAVLANTATWRNATPAAGQLVSEGVVTSAFGELRFRHSLLRDFSAALTMTPRSSEDIAGALRNVSNPIIRNELLRAIVESRLAPDRRPPGPSIDELIRECTRQGIAAGIALGTTDAPTRPLLFAVAPIDRGAVLRQALAQARLTENRAWLRVFDYPAGPRPVWFETAHVHAMASLAELALTSGDASVTALAVTLRAWTWGYRVDNEAVWAIGRIGELLVRVQGDETTAQWYVALDFVDLAFRSEFLQQVRDLGSTSVSDGSLADALDRIVFSGRTLRFGFDHSLWEVTKLCLSGHDGHAGLLSTRPSVALGLLFRLNVEQALEDERTHRALYADLVRADVLAAHPPPPSDLVAARKVLDVVPKLEEAEAIGDLVDDVPTTDGHIRGYLDEMIELIAPRAVQDAAFAVRLANAVIASRSVRARTIMLPLSGEGRVDEVVVEILRDRRMYHFRYASHALWGAIQVRWPTLPPDDRAAVQSNILDRARSPRLPFTEVGRLASAIPDAERRPEMRPYLEFLQTRGWSTVPPRPARISVMIGGDEFGDSEPGERAPAPVWRRFESLMGDEGDPSATVAAVEILRSEMRDLRHGTGGSSDSTWSTILRVVKRDANGREDARAIDTDLARPLFEAALTRAESTRSEPTSWATALEVADSCSSYVSADEAATMYVRLIAEVVAGAGEDGENSEHAWQALCAARRAWFSEQSGGRAVFERWFRNGLRGEGLRIAVDMLRFLMPGNERIHLIRELLDSGRLNRHEALAFASEVGHLLAPWAIWWEQPWGRDVLNSWCEGERPAALATAEGWRAFISGFAWSLQNQVRRAHPDPRTEAGLNRFVSLIELAWSSWRDVIDDEAAGGISVGWSVVAPLTVDFNTRISPPVGGWSCALGGLVARVIAEGGRNDIAALQQVGWQAVDSVTLASLTDTAVDRADREIASRPPTDWMIDGLIRLLGSLGTCPSVPISQARATLDCLQRLGRSAPHATTVAMKVESSVRLRDGAHSDS